jgi:two-component system, OmpR family, sensor histidine kinase KdpD
VARGKLRLYLGAAPGVGKTYAMLNEGWRRRERGTDVVVGWVEEHGRPQTDAQVRDLPVVPRRTVEYRGQSFEEMDLEGLLARRPELVLVDELAHTNIPGSGHAKRWEDVDTLLDAGINVISTVNLQHLESLNDVVERITGVAQQETVPDRVVRAADQIELVDMAPEALRRRLAHGNVYPPERIDAALGNYFRPGNLTALRELALLWVADRVDEELHDYRERHDIAGPWETKERVVVSLTGAPGSAVLVRRAARMAMRTKAELVGVHVRTDDGLTGAGSEGLGRNRALLDDLGGRFVEVVGADVAPALVQVARAENATQLVLGATHRSRLSEFVRGSVINSVIRAAGGALDVHVIATDTSDEPDGHAAGATPPERRHRRPVPDGRHRRRLLSPLPARRRLAAVLLGVVGFPLLTLLLTATGSHADLATALSTYLVLVVAVAATGGVWPGVLAALAGFMLSNYFFAPPVHTFTIADARDVLALLMFLVTAGVVSVLVDLAARRTAAAVQARSDARMLARVAGRLVSPEGNPMPALLEELLVAFRLDSASILRRPSDGSGGSGTTGTAGTTGAAGTTGTAGTTGEASGDWTTIASAGPAPVASPEGASLTLPLTDEDVLALQGPGLSAEDRDILAAFCAQLATALESDRLHAEAAEADSLARANQLRSALLAAVSHDLRTPLASIKAASSSLLSDQLEFGPDETAILLHTVDDEADRLSALVENLLDMSRLETGAMEVLARPTDVGDLVDSALASLGPRARGVVVAVDAAVPLIETDQVLVERVVANLVDNALLHGAGKSVRVEAGRVADWVDLRIIDHGPGIRPADRDLVFLPFQRLGDSGNRTGVGLGLAVSRGFVEAVGGQLDLEDTPGGGCTLVVRLPVPVDRTSTIIDADLEPDVVVPDGSEVDGRDADDAADDGEQVRP